MLLRVLEVGLIQNVRGRTLPGIIVCVGHATRFSDRDPTGHFLGSPLGVF